MASVLEDYRQKHPQYDHIPDATLADALYRKHYAGKMERAEFDRSVGMAPQAAHTSAPPASNSPPGLFGNWGASEEFGNAATFGIVDEVAAAGRATGNAIRDTLSGADGAGWSANYDKALEEIRADRDQFRDDNPILSTAAQGAGAVYTGGIGGKYIASAPGLGSAALRSGGVGAGYGTVAGFGEADGGFDQRMQGAAQGAVFGGALGGIAPPLVAGTTATLRGLKNVATRGKEALTQAPPPSAPHWGDATPYANGPGAPGATRAAHLEIAERLRRDGIAPDDFAYSFSQMGPEATLADAGGASTRQLLDTTAQLPGQTKQAAQTVFGTRQAGQGDRIKAATQSALGTDGAFYQTMEDLSASARAAAAPLYEQAYRQFPAITDKNLTFFLETPAGRRALKNAVTTMQNEGINPMGMGVMIDEAGRVSIGEAPSLQLLDYVKRGFDDVLERYRDTTTGRLSLDYEGRSVEQLRDRFVTFLDDVTGGVDGPYAQARAAWAGPARQRDALEAGRRVFKQDLELTQQRIARMGNDERAAFLEGVTRAVQDLVDRSGDTHNAVRRLFGNKRMRGIIEAAFGDKRAFDVFEARMLNEAAFAETQGAVRAGSQTFGRTADAMEMVPDLIIDASTGSPVTTGLRLGQRVFQAGTPEPVRDEIGRVLLTGTADDANAIRMTLSQRMREDLRRMGLWSSGFMGGALAGPPDGR